MSITYYYYIQQLQRRSIAAFRNKKIKRSVLEHDSYIWHLFPLPKWYINCGKTIYPGDS